jgi:hypothetical protein
LRASSASADASAAAAARAEGEEDDDDGEDEEDEEDSDEDEEPEEAAGCEAPPQAAGTRAPVAVDAHGNPIYLSKDKGYGEQEVFHPGPTRRDATADEKKKRAAQLRLWKKAEALYLGKKPKQKAGPRLTMEEKLIVATAFAEARELVLHPPKPGDSDYAERRAKEKQFGVDA